VLLWYILLRHYANGTALNEELIMFPLMFLFLPEPNNFQESPTPWFYLLQRPPNLLHYNICITAALRAYHTDFCLL